MTYKDRLHCWAIARLLPSEQWIIVARFRSRSDADGHFQFLRQTIPQVKFEVLFVALGKVTVYPRCAALPIPSPARYKG
ncbi:MULTISPECIES: hypothetical protein [unclassified Microcoleus]|uniref:hypothetical protein n=1 Tax=unclassified Microcoleus TaxID=2642155 RepID=UPI002FD0C2A4